MKLFMMTAALMGISQAGAQECGLDDISIESFKPSAENRCKQSFCPVVLLPAEIQNNCATAVGVLVKINARDSSGAVVETNEGWPASTRNIPAGERYAFDFGPLFTYRENGDRFEIHIIDVKPWR